MDKGQKLEKKIEENLEKIKGNLEKIEELKKTLETLEAMEVEA